MSATHKPAPLVPSAPQSMLDHFAPFGRITRREKATGSDSPAWPSGPLQIAWAEERRKYASAMG
jgi:hypothetical protein